MEMSPLIAVHATSAMLALVTGPVAIWARKGAARRPRLHRAFGYAWVTLMIVTAVSAIFIRGGNIPNIGGFSPIHLLSPLVLFSLYGSFRYLAQGNIDRHRKTMVRLYVGSCIVAGGFTLLPGRLIGDLVWVDWLGIRSPHLHPASAPSPSTFEGFPMIAQIVSNTPLWVWGVLVALLALGFSQTRRRTLGLARVVLPSVGLGGFSLWGTLSAFGASPAVLGSWLVAATLLMLMISRLAVPQGSSYDSASRQFTLPGSWVPMALIMGIFMTKYAVGATLAMHPEIRFNADFALVVATLNGVFSGVFAGRTVRLLRLSLRSGRPTLQRRTANA
jgi:uncharacterized membrane protein